MMTWAWLAMSVSILAVMGARISLSPMKVLLTMILIAASVSLSLTLLEGEMWFPILYLLIFVGGIMVLLVMVSAISPNTAMKKVSSTLSEKIILVMLALTISSTESLSTWSSQLKAAFLDQSTLMFLTALILMYFTLFNWAISTGMGGVRI